MKRQRNRVGFFICLIVFTQLFAAATAEAEDGYRLWLRYDPLPAGVEPPQRTLQEYMATSLLMIDESER